MERASESALAGVDGGGEDPESCVLAAGALPQSTFSSSFNFRFLEGETGRDGAACCFASLLPSRIGFGAVIPGLVALVKALMAAWPRGREERVDEARGIAVSDGRRIKVMGIKIGRYYRRYIGGNEEGRYEYV